MDFRRLYAHKFDFFIFKSKSEDEIKIGKDKSRLPAYYLDTSVYYYCQTNKIGWGRFEVIN